MFFFVSFYIFIKVYKNLNDVFFKAILPDNVYILVKMAPKEIVGKAFHKAH